MIEIDEARRHVARYCAPLSAAIVPAETSRGRFLAQHVISDIDSPPHDKSLVDGYAVRASDFDGTTTAPSSLATHAAACCQPRELRINEEVVAGSLPTMPVAQGTATRIMTGAPLPDAADAVVMVEDTQLRETNFVRLTPRTTIRPEQNILRRAASIARGQCVLSAGHVIGSKEIGLLCEVGARDVAVVRRPSVAVLATGDELVPVTEVPQPGQIRNSNGPMLIALAQPDAEQAHGLGIAPDDELRLRQLITRAWQYDVLILSGGVSAGIRDLVPGVLQEQGVVEVFHKINMRPGKPLWFGVKHHVVPTLLAHNPASASTIAASKQDTHPHHPSQTLVFGLPGNPISSLVTFELFVRPALKALAGHATAWRDIPRHEWGTLQEAFTIRGERVTYYPARLQRCNARDPSGEASDNPARKIVTEKSVHEQNSKQNNTAPQSVMHDAAKLSIVAWQGSADLCSLAQANALVRFPAGEHHYAAGARIEFIELAI